MGIKADEVWYLSRHKSPHLDRKGIQWIEGSLLDPDVVMNAVEGKDAIINCAGVWEDDAKAQFDLNVNGVKNIVTAIKKFDKDQRFIHVSSINIDYGTLEYYRTRRIAEGNVNLIKNSMVVRPSVVFGEGSKIAEDLSILVKTDGYRFPAQGNLAPVNVNDLVTVINNSGDFKGSMNVCSRESITMLELINAARQKARKGPVKGIRKSVKGMEKYMRKNGDSFPIPKYRVSMLNLNYFRENTSLYRYVESPVSIRTFIEGFEGGEK
jgi:NADH dehydrogenase